MPQIIVKGLSPMDLIDLSQSLIQNLADISNTPIDYFRLERPEVTYYDLGQEVESYPLVEVIQFDRGQAVEGQMARLIQEAVKQLGYQECEVYFTHIAKENYYE